jgi:hypothetical protein
MLHQKVFDVFKNKFAVIAAQTETWFPNGKDSVRIRLTDKQEIIFTYHGEPGWSLETIDNYLIRMKCQYS